MTIARYSLYLTFLTYPVYLFPSGEFQLSTGCVLLLLVALLISPGVSLALTRPIALHLSFVVYTIMVNVIWYTITGHPGFLKFIFFGCFAAITFASVATLGRYLEPKHVRWLLALILAAVVTQWLLANLGIGRPGYRTVVFFNNPNQLGYYCALSAATAVILGHLYRLSGPLVPLIVVASILLSALSLSKAAIAACLLYGFFIIFFNSRISWGGRLLFVLIVLGGGFASMDAFVASEFYEKLNSRIAGVGVDSDDSLGARGYNRIVDYPSYLVFGAGEGHNARFEEDIELHSYPASVLFAYGFVGMTLLVMFFTSVVPDWRTAVYLSPLLLYNLTHNGGRVVLLWCLLGLIAGSLHRRYRETGSMPRASRRRRALRNAPGAT